MKILFLLVNLYMVLSLIYTIVHFRQNVTYQWNCHEDKFEAFFAVMFALCVSLVFGGVSLISKTWASVKLKYEEVRGWYHIAKTARQLRKTLSDEIDNYKKESE